MAKIVVRRRGAEVIDSGFVFDPVITVITKAERRDIEVVLGTLEGQGRSEMALWHNRIPDRS